MKPCRRTGLSWIALAQRSGLLHLLLVLLFIVTPLSGIRRGPVLAKDATIDATSWDFLAPIGWAGRPTTVSISVTNTDGLQEDTAEYRFTTDGGSKWSLWSNSGLETHSRVTTTVQIDVTTKELIDSATANIIQFRILDALGEPLTSGEFNVAVDGSAPTVGHTVDKQGEWVEPPVRVTLEASDGEGSGVAAIEYRLEGSGTWTAGDTITISGPDGGYNYEYRARDVAGNPSEIGMVRVGLDTGAPGAVTNLRSSPQGWGNNQSDFGLLWDNPSDARDIAGSYYQVDIDPLQGGIETATYVPGEDIEEITGISVGSEGEHTAYAWLQDKAGNSDPRTRQVLERAFKYDATAPTCDEPTAVPPRPEGGYYTGSVKLTITAKDSLSGVAAIHYQIESEPVVTATVDGGPTTAQISFTMDYAEGRKEVYYWATDTAGNTQALHGSYTVRFDTLAPEPPIGLTVVPSGWISATSFTITWTNPEDYSFIAGAYYKVGSEPQWPSNGTYVDITGTPSISAQTNKEGDTQVYVWLMDGAGLYDHRNAARVTVQRDATPPETTISSSGTTRHGYYIGPLTLSFDGTDNLSGVAQKRYKINNGAEQVWDGEPIVLEQEGRYRVTYYAVDGAGNREAKHTADYTIDLKPPTARIWVEGGQDYIRTNSVSLHWEGNDGAGSGIARYTVEYQRTTCSTGWRQVYSGTNVTGTFSVAMTPNDYYYFRVRAEDRAGYVSEYSVPDQGSYVYYDGLTNGYFDSGWNGWTQEHDGLDARIVITESHTGGVSQMVQLSHDWPIREVPENAYASFYQQIQLPTLDCSDGLVLAFWYRIYSSDVMYHFDDVTGKVVLADSFDVFIKDRDGHDLGRVLRDGNMQYDVNNPEQVYRSPWKPFAVGLAAYTQQPIRIQFRVDNRFDGLRPTWVLIDDIRLVAATGHIVRLPILGYPQDSQSAVSANLQSDLMSSKVRSREPSNEGELPRRR